jgi:alkylation response protein AidB-like acyl-CoA dehydrogenase
MTLAEHRHLIESKIQELLPQFREPASCDPVAFLGAQFDAGLAWVHFDTGCGGLGLAAGYQPEIDRTLRAAGGPASRGDYVALHQGATAIHAAGSPEQRARFLRPIFTGEEHWCQLFSEPGAGSDLAGLSTTAMRDGDEWVVNGQKVWTSGAREARWAILVARTDPELPKHRGLTFFICDLQDPGVEVRPLRQADGNAHFNEVFLTDVRLPDSLRLGDVGQGWGISLACLHAEREGTGDAFARPIDGLLDLWRSCPDRLSPSAAALRQEVVKAWTEARVVELTNLRMREGQGRDGATPLGSLAKIAASEHTQRLANLMVKLLGPAGQVGLDYQAGLLGNPSGLPTQPQMLAVRSRAMSIEGGTNEIQRNIIGERVLGLPGDIRTDKDVPWRLVPRN